MSKHDAFKVAQILAKLRARHITTDREGALQAQIDRLFKTGEDGRILPEVLRFTNTGETRGVVVDGPGGGKSTLIARVLKKHPVLAMGPDGHPHFLDVIVPSPATFKGLGLEILRRTDYPTGRSRRDMWEIWHMVRGRMSDLGVSLLWIDEAHDLFCADRKLILRGLKYLMQGDEAFTLILSGTGQLEEILRSDPQLWRRFTLMHLPPVNAFTQGDELQDLVANYCQTAGLEPCIHPELLPRLVHAGRGRFGLVLELVVAAIEQALVGGHSAVDIDHFAAAYALKEACSSDRNVFYAHDWMLIDPDNPHGVAEVKRPKKSRKK